MTEEPHPPPSVGAPPARTAIGLFPVAMWFGLIGGGVQGAWVTFARSEAGLFTHVNDQIAWTAPLSTAIWMAVPGACFWFAERGRPGRWWQAGVSVYASLAAVGILMYVVRLHPLARIAVAVGIGTQAGYLATRHQAMVGRLVRRTLPVLASLVVLVGSVFNSAMLVRESRSSASLPPAESGAPNVLLLVLDTVRALDMSLYGLSRATTPEIDRFSARGTVFDRAIAPAPWTLPSHASMFTGRAPHELSADWRKPLDDRYPTLAGELSARGYLTAGFAANLAYASAESGLGRGFVHYEGHRITAMGVLLSDRLARSIVNAPVVRRLLGWHEILERKPASSIRHRLVTWLDSHPDRPWFAFANFYDAHDPYLPSAPWDTAFTGRRIPGDARNVALANESPVSPATAGTDRDAYDQAIRGLDHEIGALLTDLETRGKLRNTVVVITSDHGEEFGEHGLLGHGHSLYFPALWVPLIIAFDGRVPAGRRVAGPVSLRNLAATILDLSGSPPTLPGESLRARWSLDSTGATHPFAIAEVRKEPRQPAWYPASKGDMSSVMDDTYQLIRDGSGMLELVDLVASPTGTVRLRADSELIRRLKALLPPKG